MRNVLVDTDVASMLLKGRASDWVSREVVGRRVWVSFVGVGELWKWAEVRGWGAPRRSELETWLGRRSIIPFDKGIARLWGRLSGAAHLRGRPRPQNDTWVAACAVRHDLPLLTLNRKDYEDLVGDGLVLLREDGQRS